jgi:FtsH-binding integral membrane protein
MRRIAAAAAAVAASVFGAFLAASAAAALVTCRRKFIYCYKLATHGNTINYSIKILQYDILTFLEEIFLSDIFFGQGSAQRAINHRLQ